MNYLHGGDDDDEMGIVQLLTLEGVVLLVLAGPEEYIIVV